MRTANKNKQKLYYALKNSKLPIYERTASGSIRLINVNGVQVPVESGEYKIGYSRAVAFKGNIAESGDAMVTEFGIDVSGYDAILVIDKGSIPIDETSLIWDKTTPVYIDGNVDSSTADYTVVAVKPSLTGFKAVLKKRVK